MKTILSVIIPVYNAEKYLYRCLESIVSQLRDSVEIILVNDGSIDQSPQICNIFAKQYSSIKVIHQSNHGVSSARNKGLEIAKGEYITFVDSDDYITQNYFSSIMEALKTKKDLYFFKCIKLEKAKKEEIRDWIDQLPRNIDKEEVYRILLSGKSNEPWDKVYRNELIRSNNISFQTGVSLGEDLIFTLHFARYVKKAELIPKILYCYRILQTGLCQRKNDFQTLYWHNKLFCAMDTFIIDKKIDEETKYKSYAYMLQILTNCCGKLYKNKISRDNITKQLIEFEWFYKLIGYKYKDMKSKIRQFVLKNELYWIAEKLFRK